jgi:hypothetical protein
MPHFVTNRPRQFAIFSAPEKLTEQFGWEAFNTLVYEVGGLMFVMGSVFFLPGLEEYISVGSWLFFAASILYIVVSAYDCVEMFYHPSDTVFIDVGAAASYLIGAIVFLVGSVLFLPTVGKYNAGAMCFIGGSLLFATGAVLNAMQIFHAPSARAARYLLMTAVCYIIGSTMFVVASVPYLFTFESAKDEELIDRWLAQQYIVGSIFFLLGGLINGFRAHHIVAKHSSSNILLAKFELELDHQQLQRTE